MTAVLEAEDGDLLLLALSDIARARGMAQVGKDAGLSGDQETSSHAAAPSP
ncbi:DNA-binding protein [Variovorax sp. KK3]|nr:hypothetical protein [Variovorax sp. KK3]